MLIWSPLVSTAGSWISIRHAQTRVSLHLRVGCLELLRVARCGRHSSEPCGLQIVLVIVVELEKILNYYKFQHSLKLCIFQIKI